MRGGKIEAKLLMSIPEVRWVGDKLLYIYKRDIREWANGEIAHDRAIRQGLRARVSARRRVLERGRHALHADALLV